MDYILVPKIWASTSKGVSECQTKITLQLERAVSNIRFFFPRLQSHFFLLYFEHSCVRYFLLTPKTKPHALAKMCVTYQYY
jgi:hypothetical protein